MVNKNTGEWAFGYYREYFGRHQIFTDLSIDGSFFDWVDVDLLTVGQYIRKDSWDNDIYEGDIFKVKDDWDFYGWYAGDKAVIRIVEGVPMWVETVKRNPNRVLFESDVEGEVVGNIYDK